MQEIDSSSTDLVRLTEEAKEMTRDPEAARKRHHKLLQAIWKMQTNNAQKLVSTIEGFINPLSYPKMPTTGFALLRL